MKDAFVEKFSLGQGYDEVVYTLSVSKKGELRFYASSRNPEAIGIENDPNDWDMPDWYHTIYTTGTHKNAVKVLREVKRIFRLWVFGKHLPHFWFYALTAKKARLYIKMIDSIAGAEQYQSSVYHDDDDGVFVVNYVRK